MKKTALIKTITLASLILLVSLVSVKTVRALTMTVIPPQVEIEVMPGKSATADLKVRNDSQESQVLNAKVLDFIVNNDQGTPLILEDYQPDNRWSASSWIQVSPTQIRLEPGETKAVRLIVLAPQTALPGGHYATVLYSPDKSGNLQNGSGSSVDPRAGTLVSITVPGDIKEDARVTKFSLPSFLEYGPVNILTSITNLSDIHIKPLGNISIKNWFGKKIANLPLKDTNIFPYTSRDFENVFNRKWLFGRYQAQLNASYGTTGQALIATAYLWVIPWKLLLALLIVTVLIITITKLLKNKKKKKEALNSTPSEELKTKYQDKQ